MRILKLRFQNLNSLLGEWSIDFTDPAYMANGIFAITGPTGAGKTTILDAVCLALYGRTPRLNRVNKSGNEIMSRQTGYCYAELSFETREGQFCCHWSQQRARKRPDGELQLPKHEIADLANGQVLESKIREVAVLVERITGMSFEQFTRSILLAQGGFAAFLQAPPDERAPILEQITGTEIYSAISIKVHQRRGEEKAKLENLEAEITGIKLLSEEEEQILRTGLKMKIEKADKEKEELNSLHEAIKWLDELAELAKQIEILEEQWQNCLISEEAFKPRYLSLERSRRAMLLDGPYIKLSALRKQQKDDCAKLLDIQKELLPHGENVTASNLLMQKALDNLEEFRKHYKEEREIIKRVREIDLLIEQRLQGIKAGQVLIDEGENTCAELQGQISKGYEQREEMKSALRDIELYIRENAPDASLVNSLGSIAKGFDRIRNTAALLDEKQIESGKAAKELQTWMILVETKAAEYEKSCINLSRLDIDLKVLQDELINISQGRELGEWRQELESLKEQKNVLRELDQSLNRIAQVKDNQHQHQESYQKLQQQQNFFNIAIGKLTEKIYHGERELKQMETQINLLNRIRDLEEERACLEDGKACPLCGATEHPFARGNLPRIDEAELSRDKLNSLLKNLQQELHNSSLKKVEIEKDLEFTAKLMEEHKLLLESESERCRLILIELGLQASIEGESFAEVKERLHNMEEIILVYSQTLTQIEAGQKSERQLAAIYDECNLVMINAENGEQQALAQQKQAEKETNRLHAEYRGLQTQLDAILQEVLQELAEYGILNLELEEMPYLLERLRIRQVNWIDKQDAKLKLEQALALLQTEIAKQEILLATRKEQLLRDLESFTEQEKQAKKLRDARWELYGGQNATVAEENLDKELMAAEAVLENARKDLELAQRKQEQLHEWEKTLGKVTQDRALELKETEADFRERLHELEFEHENDYMLAILSAAEQQVLAQEAEELRDRKKELQTRLFDRKAQLSLEQDKKLTDQPREALEEKGRLVEQDLKVTQDAIGVDKHILQSSSENRAQLQEQVQKIKIQKDELRRWEMLHNLIGSADGKKFRNFAQGLTFDIMIAHANRQLQKMSDRYLLQRHSRQALELNVIDNYQAGEIRSTANLSGGESFLVSLSLALGLSQMVSCKVSVDALFLDEGFGALDEDALDIALDTLAGLQRDGKLIGVISHVPAIKERIATQIQVISKSGGRSILQGPGCSQLRNIK